MVRPNELSFARRGALNKLAARRQGARPSQLTAVFIGVDPEDDSRVIVSFDGSEVSVLAGPVRMTPGALCAVEVDSANAPVRVIGPVTTRPAGLDEGVEAPAPVTAMPELAPREGMTEEELQRLQDTADDLAQAREDLVDARAEAERNFGTLDDKLGQAFPTGPFDVGAEITSSASATLTAAALDAQAKANDAAQAAQEAAQQYADGEIGEAELRAAQDAEAKANAARDAAVATANAHADDAASAAEQAALSGAQAYADLKKTEAIQAAATDAQAKAEQAAQAAQTAAKEHADLVAQGASQAAIDAAALDAQAKADAARDAAKAHADAQAAAAENAAKTHATNEAARVKQEALTEAATDAQTKADNAASAAEAAAKAYAELQASGASADALADAKVYADLKKSEAISAAEDSALAYAESAKNAAIDAAALTAQTKADVAKQAAIEAAATDAQTKANKAKTDAINAAATDAQAKAAAAADAAEQAAKAYALAQAEGLSGQALADAKADATAKANAAEKAAKDAAAADALSKANAAQQAAIDAAKADLDALEVGGRNLVHNSGGVLIDRLNSLPGSRGEYSSLNIGQSYMGVADGTTVTVSFDLEMVVNTDRPRVMVYNTNSPGPKRIGNVSITFPDAVAGDYINERVSLTTSILDHGDPRYTDNYIEFYSTYDTSNWFKISNLKVERGTKATDWTPAPEDVDAGIEGALDVATTADGKATTAVTEAGTAKTNAATAISTASAADTKAGQAVTTAGQANTKAGQAVTTANTAKSTADTAKSTADTAKSTATTAKSTADTAKSTADTAKSKADSAYQYAADVEDIALNASTQATTAMTTADGKNTTSYADVTSAPGPTPTTASGAKRKRFDMHRNRLSDGTVVAEWMWSGTSWVPVHMGDAMLRSLDVGKLTAGTANIETAVINRLWSQLGVFDKLDVRQDAYISGINLKDGAVTARTLNVVHTDSDTGAGWRAEPEGLTFLDQNGSPSITLRTDMTNSFSVMEDGVSVASISEEGDVTGRSVAANESLLYRTEELADLLMVPARGIISHSVANGNISIGTSAGRVVSTTFRTPPDDRMVTVQYNGYLSNGGSRRGRFDLRQSTGNSVTPANSSKAWWRTNTQWAESFNHSVTMSVSDWGWPLDGTITVGIFAYSETSGETLAFSWGRQELIVRDEGPAVVTQKPTPWAPSTGGGDGTGSEGETGTREYSPSYDATSHKTYSRSSTTHVRAGKSLVQGYVAGVTSRGHWIFPASTIKSAISGTTELSGSLTIRNEHTYSSAGMTAVLKVHNYSSAPSTFGTTRDWTSVSVPRGRAVTIKLPSWILDGLKAGTIKGFSLDSGTSTSSTYYGYFSPKATLSFKYKK